jgi:two-component system, cell cycle response regulator DivK
MNTGTKPAGRKTILYVEDNEANRKMVRLLLINTAYALIEAYDGEAGVAKALEIRPDLILGHPAAEDLGP